MIGPLRRAGPPTGPLIPVGYWQEIKNECDVVTAIADDVMAAIFGRLPRVSDFRDPKWDRGERTTVLEYVRSGKRHAAYYGVSSCRICGDDVGCLDLTDGVYVWPDGLAHYIAYHDVKPPIEFVKHALRSPQRVPRLEAYRK